MNPHTGRIVRHTLIDVGMGVVPSLLVVPTGCEMHVFGASQGESIVLKLPGGGWGVVDCYASRLSDLADNAVLCFLSDRGVGELEFLCLTHPHDDHFRGMSHLLQRLRVHSFWRPSAM